MKKALFGLLSYAVTALALAAELAALNEKLRKQFDGLGKLTVADVLRFPG